jgi:CO/xanthine dehydrogenase Mo-binding subunit/aerobic-type carbon monoxide dehydrogenase small subunit (CoxS/CutS family)
MAITIVVNGTRREIADADATLLSALRDELGVTGPKPGCGEGECGACTVLIGRRAVPSCQVRADEASGQRVTTAEGLAEDGLLHPVQQAWLETGAMQCGYCTAGWLTATAALLARVPRPTDERMAAELTNICRCGTYPRIRRAVHRAAELMGEPELLAAVPAAGAVPAGLPAPPVPWDLARTDPQAFTAAMPEGLMTVVAGDAAGAGQDGYLGPNDAWVHVGADGTVTAFTGKVEGGQGTRTALAMLVAEELGVPAGGVAVVMGDTGVVPYDAGTFGSRSMPLATPALRAAAAAARRLLTQAAAERFGLDPSALRAANGVLAGPDGAPSISYGELVAGQRRCERVPADAASARGAGAGVTPADRWRVAGHDAPASGAPDVVTGAKRFPADLRVAGMRHGAVLRPPSHGATLLGADTAAAAAQPGVTVVADGAFVGVVAPTAAAARAALALVDARWAPAAWDEPDPVTPASLEAWLRAHPVDGGFAEDHGDVETALQAGPVTRAARYHAAYIAHVPMEPRSALAHWPGDGRLVVFTGTSTPFRARGELAAALGVPRESVQVSVPDYGGGFGGKHGSAVALEAARLARAAGAPVHVQWTRQEEFQGSYLRPAAVIDVAAAAGPGGDLTAWSFTNLNSGAVGLQPPYRIPHRRLRYQPATAPLPQGSYRALAATANSFARESHLDELALAAGADPVEFRLRHLDDDRLAAVLRAAAAEIGWGAAEPDGTGTGTGIGTGIALGREKDGRVATAARVHVAPDGTLRVLTLVTAVDVGAVVYPDGLVNQVEGAVMMGLGGALFEAIDFRGGKILNAALSSYRVPRLADLPDLRVVLLDRPDLPSAGGGETPIIAVAPAIGNAIYRACGVRLRALPMTPKGRVPGVCPA